MKTGRLLQDCEIMEISIKQLKKFSKDFAEGGVPLLPAGITSIVTASTEIREPEGKICETASHKFETDPELLISRLSFSHIVEIMKLDDSFERFFYEHECIRGVWSVRELQRQIIVNDINNFTLK